MLYSKMYECDFIDLLKRVVTILEEDVKRVRDVGKRNKLVKRSGQAIGFRKEVVFEARHCVVVNIEVHVKAVARRARLKDGR